MPKLVINFFSTGEDFLSETFRLESCLSEFGRLSSIKGGGIAVFTLSTNKTSEETMGAITELCLHGTITCKEEENDREMASA